MPAKKQITKSMILNAALELLKREGYAHVNIKQLSKELGCSTQPIYLSFSGMDALRSELIPLAIGEFEIYMRRSGTAGAGDLYGMDYIRFAKEEPRLFCFLFMRSNAFSEIRQALLPIIARSMNELMDRYHIGPEEADLLHDQLWMHAHGIASMVATDFCHWDMEKIEKMLERCKAAFTQKYEA